MTTQPSKGAILTSLDDFTAGYLTTALWAETDNANEQGGESLDTNHSVQDFTESALRRAVADCAKFQADNAADIAEGPDGVDFNREGRAGHDFWLTRNHHGAGFWDGDWEEAAGERLTKAAHAFGELSIFVQDGVLDFD